MIPWLSTERGMRSFCGYRFIFVYLCAVYTTHSLAASYQIGLQTWFNQSPINPDNICSARMVGLDIARTSKIDSVWSGLMDISLNTPISTFMGSADNTNALVALVPQLGVEGQWGKLYAAWGLGYLLFGPGLQSNTDLKGQANWFARFGVRDIWVPNMQIYIGTSRGFMTSDYWFLQTGIQYTVLQN
jgi:hypothetical protein